MRISGEGGDFLELEIARLGPAERPPSPDEDLLLVAVVRFGGFSGKTETWVGAREWAAFLSMIEALERDRTGTAKLESISPDELELTFAVVDRAGHVGVEGLLGVTTSFHEASIRFSIMKFDPSTLPTVVRELRALKEGSGQ